VVKVAKFAKFAFEAGAQGMFEVASIHGVFLRLCHHNQQKISDLLVCNLLQK
jgi:hypothetical protein